MTECCINTFDTEEVGRIVVGSVYAYDKWQILAMKILEKITIKEYLDFCKETGFLQFVNRDIHDPKLNFYRVEVLD